MTNNEFDQFLILLLTYILILALDENGMANVEFK